MLWRFNRNFQYKRPILKIFFLSPISQVEKIDIQNPMDTIKIKAGEIVVGNTLPWPVYDKNRRLLLNEGELISSQGQLQVLLEHGLYRENNTRHANKKGGTANDDILNPFEKVDQLATALNHVFFNIVNKKPDCERKVNTVSVEVQRLCEWDANAALGAVHLCHHKPYTVWHPLHVAMLSELITKRMGYRPQARLTVINAALTSNIAMLELQESLYRQDTPLSDDQKKAIQQHCQHGVGMLHDADINDQLWLDIVFQHHEKIDGSGYPVGLDGDAINKEALVISLSDRYSAMISPRSYREGMTAQNALGNLFIKKGKEFSQDVAVMFIKELGVYPPGSFVKLNNDEIAIVIKRGQDTTAPVVCSLVRPQGEYYERPVLRDSGRKDYAIKEICPRIKTTSLYLPRLWGYN